MFGPWIKVCALVCLGMWFTEITPLATTGVTDGTQISEASTIVETTTEEVETTTIPYLRRKTVSYAFMRKAVNDSKVYILDIREPYEPIKFGKIPNSINIAPIEVQLYFNMFDESEFLWKHERAKPKHDDMLVLFSNGGNRSVIALRELESQGFTNVWTYQGDWAMVNPTPHRDDYAYSP